MGERISIKMNTVLQVEKWKYWEIQSPVIIFITFYLFNSDQAKRRYQETKLKFHWDSVNCLNCKPLLHLWRKKKTRQAMAVKTNHSSKHPFFLCKLHLIPTFHSLILPRNCLTTQLTQHCQIWAHKGRRKFSRSCKTYPPRSSENVLRLPSRGVHSSIENRRTETREVSERFSKSPTAHTCSL